MPETVNLGPFLLQWKLLALFLSVLAGLAAINWRLKGNGHKRLIIDCLTTGLMIVALLWKFGELLFDPLLLFRRPTEALYMAASTRGACIGAICAVSYALWKLKRAGVSPLVLLDALPVGILSGVMLDCLLIWQYGRPTHVRWGIALNDPALRYHPLNAYLFIASAAILILLLRKKAAKKRGDDARFFFVLFGLCGLVISLFARDQASLFYLTFQQWVYAAMLGVGILLPREKDENV
ncbi:MAG TPA: prolipoprotein diacylglyceryl transferase family protein [Bacilli bacterium]